MFPQEVKYIWRASWNYTKVLYLFARYIPFACLSLLIRSKFCLPVLVPRLCLESFTMCLDSIFRSLARYYASLPIAHP